MNVWNFVHIGSSVNTATVSFMQMKCVTVSFLSVGHLVPDITERSVGISTLGNGVHLYHTQRLSHL